ncbi:MAG: hypothetical protein U0Y82_04480 [Thermoleophilia bacterium]
MAVRTAGFWALGGFDTLLAHDYNDADLCFRAWATGGRVVLAPGVRLVHHEGASRGRAVHPDTVADWLVFRTRWSRRLAAEDPWGPPAGPA